MRKRRLVLLAVGALVGSLYVLNASWRVAPLADASVQLISHRGVHQTYHREGLKRDTCTAERIDQPRHAYIENTVPSMAAAFATGADIVELDVHPTTDGYLAVFHDWTLDCRTDGAGETRSRDLAYLKSLDVAHGYTHDGGATYPLRGKGVGLMPELREVLAAFPGKKLLVNFKSREAREGDMLASILADQPQWRDHVWDVYGGHEPTQRARETIGGDLAAWSRQTLVGCLGRYVALGWSGMMPAAATRRSWSRSTSRRGCGDGPTCCCSGSLLPTARLS